jgi:Zn-dependent peptidase ImmA (M78 family)
MNSHIKHIENLALRVLKSVNCTAPPVPVEKIAQKFNLEIVEFPFHSEISGLLKKERGVIGVNKGQHPYRRRFTIAHELGHFLLGHDMGKEEIIDSSFDRPLPQEREANIFASVLLMPSEWAKSSAKKTGIDIEKLSKEYEVSKQAVAVRLLELNLIK